MENDFNKEVIKEARLVTFVAIFSLIVSILNILGYIYILHMWIKS
jgi:hypothetical protein